MADHHIQEPSSPMDKDYKEMTRVTAMGWSSSPPPDQIGEVVAEIKDSATDGPLLELLRRCYRLLYDYKDTTMNDCGLNLLSHLVSTRWGELTDELKQRLFSFLAGVIATIVKADVAWSTKNKIAFLLSQLIAKDMHGIWKDLVDASTICLQQEDDMEAEINIVICLSEGITIPDDDLKDKRSNIVKFQNWDSLLEPLFHLIHKHLAKCNTQTKTTQNHADFALFIAETACAYARWVEVKNLVRGVGGTNLIESCTVLLGQGSLLPEVLDYLSEICSRVQPADCTPVVLTGIFNTHFKLLKDFPLSQDMDELDMDELRQIVCSSLVSIKKALGSDFEDIREGVISELKRFKAAGFVTNEEYYKLWDELFVDMDIVV